MLLTYLYILNSIYTIYHYFVFGQIVSEYERAVMFRLGRALAGARGPGELNRITPNLLKLSQGDSAEIHHYDHSRVLFNMRL